MNASSMTNSSSETYSKTRQTSPQYASSNKTKTLAANIIKSDGNNHLKVWHQGLLCTGQMTIIFGSVI